MGSGLYAPYKKPPYRNFRQRQMSDWVNQLYASRVPSMADIEEKQAWMEFFGNCITRQITLTSLSRRHVTLIIVDCRK